MNQVVKLSDISIIQTGGTPSRKKREYWSNGNIPWLKISDLKYKYVTESEEMISDEGLQHSSSRIFPANTILYSVFATIGEVSILNSPMATNQAIAGIQLTDDDFLPEYLYFYLSSIKDEVKRKSRGVAQNNINLSMLRNLLIPKISKPRQFEICKVLNQIESLMGNLRFIVRLLDQLIKSRFTEMFENPLNPTSTEKLENIADISSGITKGRKQNSTSLQEVPYMAVSNVKDGFIDFENLKTIAVNSNELAKYRLLDGDVLMTEGGDPDKLGRGAVLRNPPDNCIHQNHIFRVRFDKTKIIPEYFSAYLQQPVAKLYFLRCAKQTTGIASINMTQLRALPVIVPNLKLQIAYEDYVKQIDKSKFAIQESINELEKLKKSLMQEYFG